MEADELTTTLADMNQTISLILDALKTGRDIMQTTHDTVEVQNKVLEIFEARIEELTTRLNLIEEG